MAICPELKGSEGLNSKERFFQVCRFETPDKLPVDYLGHQETDKRLKDYLNLKSEDELLAYLGSDFFYLPSQDISQNEGYMFCYKGKELDVTETQRTCPLGIRYWRGSYRHKFAVDEVIWGPLEQAENEQDILQHNWPKVRDFDFSLLHPECDAHADKVVVGGLWTGIMGDSYRLHGFQNFLMNMALKPQLIKTLINRVTDLYLEFNNAIFNELKGKIDLWYWGNDYGSQSGLLLSQEMWYEFFFENIKKLTTLAHSYGLKVMMHSCGGIFKIIPGIIKAKIDILDPIQITARGMQPERLADEFGGKIVFHGGIDTQQILPNGSPEEVILHAKEIPQVLGKHGGYIFAPSQVLAPDIPIENILAMYGKNDPKIK